jgi:serine/threonine-protein kinase
MALDDLADEEDEDEDFTAGQPGLVVGGKYELRHLLGKGGMGAVWAAMHLGLGQMVALKIISKSHAKSREARRRFDAEAKAAARLKSRHVVQVLDNGELPDGTPFIAMELLEGESLRQRIARGPLPLPEVVVFLDQMARALDRAHEHGVVHRDIKPDNIFLARTHDDDTGITVKVLDFGIAKIADPQGGTSQTSTGVIIGTPHFMSPEQARGLRTLDYRSDLYSLGMVVYQMATGRTAFTGQSMIDLVVKVCTFALPSFSIQGGAWFPSSLDAWFRKACHREPEQRFTKAREMADAFAVAAGVRDGPSRDSAMASLGGLGNLAAPPPPSPVSFAPTLKSDPMPEVLTPRTESSFGGAQRSPSGAPPARGKTLWAALGGGVLGSGLAAFLITRSFLHAGGGAPPVAATPPSVSAAAAAATPSLAVSAASSEPAPLPVPSASVGVAAAAAPSASVPSRRAAPVVKPSPAPKPGARAQDPAAGVEVGF